MGISLPGLASGLDSTALIKAMMDVERLPQLQLQKKVNTSQILTTTLQALNSRIASLSENAKTFAKADALDLFKTSSSSDKVTATAANGAGNAELSLNVTATAQKHSAVTATMTATAGPSVLTVTADDGTRTEITAGSASLDDVIKAVNNSDTGITATKVSAGKDAITGESLYRLQFTSKETGAAAAFQVHAGTEADTAAGTAPDLFAAPGAAVLQTGKDAEVVLYAGTAAEQTITSSTNTFKDILPGVEVTVSGITTEPGTLSITRDTEATSDKAKSLVDSLNYVFNYIKANTAVTSSTNGNGATSTKGGVLIGDSTVRTVQNAIMTAAIAPIDGKSPSEFGIEVTKTGTIEFNAEKFAAAMEADPQAVENALTTIAGRVDAAAVNASDKYDGLITSKITGQEKMVRSLGDQILNWDKRIATREATLKKVYNNLEVMMSRMNSQMSYLQSQISGLPSFNQNNK